MSAPRKPKPPDKGASPEHKPSRKVALEEVMRTLQDLVSNELSVKLQTSTDAAASPESGNPDRISARKSKAAREKDHVPLGDNIEVPGTLPVSEIPPGSPEGSVTDSHGPSRDPKKKSIVSARPETAPAESRSTVKVPAGGLQQELPYFDTESTTPATAPLPEPDPPAEPQSPSPAVMPDSHEEPDDAQLIHATTFEEIDKYQIKSSRELPAPETADDKRDEHGDDIPVLDEVVELDAELSASIPDREPGSTASHASPSAAHAHRLAVQVAARLNVELRKSGQPGMSSDIITRLARLLQEALAKESSTMENTPPDRH